MHVAVTEESIQKANALFWEQMLAMPMQPIAEKHWDADPGPASSEPGRPQPRRRHQSGRRRI